ncbi:hypothetical protein CXG81DRAFT_2949, partial [Caulochytrium protostelioides]
LDARVPTLIKNGVAQNHRSFFVMVGDRGKDQVVTLHYLLTKARVSSRPDVLWCYKKELGFSSNRRKRMRHVQKQIKKGIREVDEDDPFDIFVSSTNIRYSYYKETDKILGNTYGMCILQDFEAVTPNLLARTIETVEGGGLVVLLLKSMSSLKQLYTMTMDVHARYRTAANEDTVARFNERFLLSLGQCANCLVTDDELNVLPLTQTRTIEPFVVQTDAQGQAIDPDAQKKQELIEGLEDAQPITALVKECKTLDQAKAVMTFIDAIAEKKMNSTVALTAARGRGKSASMGLALASAVAYGYSNIFVTSPSPENLKTFFEFVVRALKALNYAEHIDYELVQSTLPEYGKAIVRINIHRDHRQTVQWIQPQDHHQLTHCELLIVDEAAAIPLPLLRKLLGPYLVFMASTINGYEGTGRALQLKLLKQLREESTSGRPLREITLEIPIRYGHHDPVEAWLDNLLCLRGAESMKAVLGTSGCPNPAQCELFEVNRDSLFSYHPASEAFLQSVMSLYVAGHYKNSPNDLQLLSDAPAHRLYVLLARPKPTDGPAQLPMPLVVIQVAMEGQIAANSINQALARGVRTAGDLIPWVVSQQFGESDFGRLSGCRVIRIATHPDLTGMGYGRRAMEELVRILNQTGSGLNLDEAAAAVTAPSKPSRLDDDADAAKTSVLLSEKLAPRAASQLGPLLSKGLPLKSKLDWFGVSFGLTPELLRFWRRLEMAPIYLRQTANELTGEHTCIMLRHMDRALAAAAAEDDWLTGFVQDFQRRMLDLTGMAFRAMPVRLIMGMLPTTSSVVVLTDKDAANALTSQEIPTYFTRFDLKRLASYADNLVDFHVVADLLPRLAQLYFDPKGCRLILPPSKAASAEASLATGPLSAIQQSLLVGMGLQMKSMDDMVKELNVGSSQLLALFSKSMRRFSKVLGEIEMQAEQ